MGIKESWCRQNSHSTIEIYMATPRESNTTLRQNESTNTTTYNALTMNNQTQDNPPFSFFNPWPFSHWEIDILGLFSKTMGQKRIMEVTMEYFSKWRETKDVPNIIAKKMVDFVWENIICRFGISRTLISNNGKKFNCKVFKDFTRIWECDISSPQWCIRKRMAKLRWQTGLFSNAWKND